jgi:hypothetical protein
MCVGGIPSEFYSYEFLGGQRRRHLLDKGSGMLGYVTMPVFRK